MPRPALHVVSSRSIPNEPTAETSSSITLLNYSTRMQASSLHAFQLERTSFCALWMCVSVWVGKNWCIAFVYFHISCVFFLLCYCCRYRVCILHFVFCDLRTVAYLHHVSQRFASMFVFSPPFGYRQVSISQMHSFIAADCSHSSIACLLCCKINGLRFLSAPFCIRHCFEKLIHMALWYREQPNWSQNERKGTF